MALIETVAVAGSIVAVVWLTVFMIRELFH
jgi:hypothetical protein